MKTRLQYWPKRTSWLPFLLFLGVRLAAGAQDATWQLSAELAANLEIRLEQGINSSVVVGVVDGAGRRHYHCAGTLGFADGQSTGTPDEHTVYEIGSITKVFTGILLAHLAETEGLSLDDPVEDFVPDRVTVPARDGEVIRLIHLATHRSGLPRIPLNMGNPDPSNPYAEYRVEEMYEFLSNYSLPRAIGAKAEYSNLGFGLLGHLMELELGQDYGEILTSRVFRPLGMNESAIELDEELGKRLAAGHVGVIPVPNWELPALAGAGALRSTAHDMLIFLTANMQVAAREEGELEGPLERAIQSSHEPRSNMPNEARIGLGWLIQEGSKGEFLWHNGGTGGYRSFAGFRRDGSLGVVVLTNSSSSLDDVGAHLLDPASPMRDFPERPEIPVEFLEELAGEYAFMPGLVLEVKQIRGHLTAQLTGQPRLMLTPKSATEFDVVEVEAKLQFLRDDDGQVTGVTLFQNGIEQLARRQG